MVRTATMTKIRELADDGEWKTLDQLAEVTGYAHLWIRELRHEHSFEVREDVGMFRLTKPAAADAAPA